MLHLFEELLRENFRCGRMFSPARILDVGRIVLPTYRVRFVIVFYLLGSFIYPGIFYAGSVEKNEQGKIDSIFYGSCITEKIFSAGYFWRGRYLDGTK